MLNNDEIYAKACYIIKNAIKKKMVPALYAQGIIEGIDYRFENDIVPELFNSSHFFTPNFLFINKAEEIKPLYYEMVPIYEHRDHPRRVRNKLPPLLIQLDVWGTNKMPEYIEYDLGIDVFCVCSYHDSMKGVAESVYVYTFSMKTKKHIRIPLFTVIEYNEKDIKKKIEEKEFWAKHWEHFISHFPEIIKEYLMAAYIEEQHEGSVIKESGIGRLHLTSKDILSLMLVQKPSHIEGLENAFGIKDELEEKIEKNKLSYKFEHEEYMPHIKKTWEADWLNKDTIEKKFQLFSNQFSFWDKLLRFSSIRQYFERTLQKHIDYMAKTVEFCEELKEIENKYEAKKRKRIEDEMEAQRKRLECLKEINKELYEKLTKIKKGKK